jgi:hypothetical protein
MSDAGTPVPGLGMQPLADDAALLSATVAAISDKLRHDGHVELTGLAGQVAALCSALPGAPWDDTLARQLLGLGDELQRLVADLDAGLRTLRRALDAGNQRLAAVRAYRTSRTEPR